MNENQIDVFLLRNGNRFSKEVYVRTQNPAEFRASMQLTPKLPMLLKEIQQVRGLPRTRIPTEGGCREQKTANNPHALKE